MAFYKFNLNPGGSYLQQTSVLPNPRSNCSAYMVEGCQECPGSDGSNCDSKCTTGCNSYLNQEQTGKEDLCCHFNKNNDSTTCCASECGQVENMAACGVVLEDSTDLTDYGCRTGHRLACTRSCSSRCPVPGSTTNFFQYMGVFQVTQDKDKYKTDGSNTDGCNINNKKNCTQGDSNHCYQMLGDKNYEPWQNCIYDSNDFTKNATAADIDNWAKYYAKSPNRNYDEIMVKWCSQSVNGDCPPTDSLSKTKDKTCSRFYQQTDDGGKCQKWYGNVEEKFKHNYLDSIASNYCSKNNTNECQCINRGQDKQYRETKNSFPYNDGCWYNPCRAAFAPNYFIPSDVDVTLNEGQCPTNVCASVVNAKGYNKTYINNNKVYISCETDDK